MSFELLETSLPLSHLDFQVGVFVNQDYALTPLNYADDGLTLSWGHGDVGQLGQGAVKDLSIPTVVSGLIDSDITMIACGAEYSIAVSAEKEVAVLLGRVHPVFLGRTSLFGAIRTLPVQSHGSQKVP